MSRDGGNELVAGVGVERPRAASEEQDATSEGQRETVSDDKPQNSGEELEAELERLRVVIEQQKETISFLEGQNEAMTWRIV